MTTMPIYALVDTWDAAGTTFKGISLDVTDTASAAGSLLMDLQVGGSSRFSVGKVGNVTFSNGTNAYVVSAGANGAEFRVTGGNTAGVIASTLEVRATTSTNRNIGLDTLSLYMQSGGTLQWNNSTTNCFAAADLLLTRDAANTLAQRNGTNPQAFRIYNTFTDASNFERGFMKWDTNVLKIGTEKAGTGTARALELQTDGVTAVTVSNNQEVKVNTDQFVVQRKAGGGEYGQIAFGTTNAGNHAVLTSDYFRFRNRAGTAGAFLEMIEQTAPAAPAANEVRIYAVDNGSGKTQLMALFATGAAQQIAIEP